MRRITERCLLSGAERGRELCSMFVAGVGGPTALGYLRK